MGLKENATHLKIQWPDGSFTTEPFKGSVVTINYSMN